jgi:hypothetical protein
MVHDSRSSLHLVECCQRQGRHGGNSAGGYYKVGQEMNDPILDRIAKLGDECTGTPGVLIVSCDSGAGFESLLPGVLSAILARKETRVDSRPGSSAVDLVAE